MGSIGWAQKRRLLYSCHSCLYLDGWTKPKFNGIRTRNPPFVSNHWLTTERLHAYYFVSWNTDQQLTSFLTDLDSVALNPNQSNWICRLIKWIVDQVDVWVFFSCITQKVDTAGWFRIRGLTLQCPQVCEFESRHQTLSRLLIFPLICCKKCTICSKRLKINEKETEYGRPIKKFPKHIRRQIVVFWRRQIVSCPTFSPFN